MDIYKVLTLLEKLEGDFSDLYIHLHEEYRLNKEAAEFFYNMHIEEEAHRQVVRMERRIVQASPKAFSEPHVNLSEINSLLENIANLKKTKLELPELIGRIYGLESSAAQKYFVDAIQDTNDELREFLLNLGDTCTAHREKVAAFARKLGVEIETIKNRHAKKARIAFGDRVTINESLAVRGVDISEGGLFLLTGRTFPLGESVSLAFNVLQLPVSAHAIVQFNIEGVGMGVSFTDLADSDREIIAQFVSRRIEEKGLEKDRRVLLVGNSKANSRDTRIYMNALISEGYKVVDITGFEETVNALRKGIDLSCVVTAFETEFDTNYYILHYITTLDRYKNLPVLVLINSQDKQFRTKLVNNKGVKLLSAITTSPKRLLDEVKDLVG